jgi:hypothetical protein
MFSPGAGSAFYASIVNDPYAIAQRGMWEFHRQKLERRAERLRRSEAAAGRRVDVPPARQHVERLLAGGMTIEDVAVRSKLDRATVRRMLKPATKGVFCESAATMLAVKRSPARR